MSARSMEFRAVKMNATHWPLKRLARAAVRVTNSSATVASSGSATPIEMLTPRHCYGVSAKVRKKLERSEQTRRLQSRNDRADLRRAANSVQTLRLIVTQQVLEVGRSRRVDHADLVLKLVELDERVSNRAGAGVGVR